MKVLFVAVTFPVPPHAGAKVALLDTLRSIEELCETHLLAPRTEENSDEDVAVLRRMLPQTRIHFYRPRSAQPATLEKYAVLARSAVFGNSYHASIWLDPNLRAAVADLWSKHRFDIVHCEWLYPAIALQGMELPLVVRTLDLHFVILRGGVDEVPSGKNLRKSIWRLEAERFRRFEVGILNNALVTIAVSAEDEAVLRQEGVSRLITIPPPKAVPEQTPIEREEKQGCTALFLGMLHATVNRESSFIFTDEIWPKLSDEVRAQVKVVFAGGKPDEGARRRASECGIRIEAPLSDERARTLYAEADIFLSPVNTGTGIKTKTLEAMANGKAIIGFRNSFRGVPVENGKHALVADSNEEFARLFERLVIDHELRRRLGEAARDFISQNFNPKSLGPQLIAAYASAAQLLPVKAAAR